MLSWLMSLDICYPLYMVQETYLLLCYIKLWLWLSLCFANYSLLLRCCWLLRIFLLQTWQSLISSCAPSPCPSPWWSCCTHTGPGGTTWYTTNITYSSHNIHYQGIFCKLMGATQNTCVFFSTFSIALIAIDRYFFIVHSPNIQISIIQALFLSLMSFMVSALLASPLFLVTHLTELPSLTSNKSLFYCFEDWTTHTYKQVYALVCLVTQYLGPCMVVMLAYVR